MIDGQQRLRSLQWFYEGIFEKTGRRFTLEGVQSAFNGSAYKSLKDHDRRRLDDSILHATIVKQDEPTEDKSSIYHIFERLNTGGTRLTPQEIRACIYHGKFNDLLRDLNKLNSWRSIFGKVHSRMRDQELILRFLALYFYTDSYNRPMKGFLNIYMAHNRQLNRQSKEQIIRTFKVTTEIIFKSIGRTAFKPKRALNAAVFDSIMVGVAQRLKRGEISDLAELRKLYGTLLKNDKFITSIESRTANNEQVQNRIELAVQAFADAP